MASASEAELRSELTTFQCKECYVYKVPPASSIGHRAEFWDVDHWLQEISLKIITCDEDCTIRMFDFKSGALFAECTIPHNLPLTTVVEPVVDSSRYFALRIEDPVSKRHAFIGIGFRERTEASDFNAALYEHTQYLRRKKEALEMRAAYESSAESAEGAASTSQSDFSLKPGETITLKLAKAKLTSTHVSTPALQRINSNTATVPQFQSTASSSGQIPLLAPPPANSPSQLPLQQSEESDGSAPLRGPNDGQAGASSPSGNADAQGTNDQASAAAQQQSTQQLDASEQQDQKSAKTLSAAAPAAAQKGKDSQSKLPADDWGDFVS